MGFLPFTDSCTVMAYKCQRTNGDINTSCGTKLRIFTEHDRIKLWHLKSHTLVCVESFSHRNCGWRSLFSSILKQNKKVLSYHVFENSTHIVVNMLYNTISLHRIKREYFDNDKWIVAKTWRIVQEIRMHQKRLISGILLYFGGSVLKEKKAI